MIQIGYKLKKRHKPHGSKSQPDFKKTRLQEVTKKSQAKTAKTDYESTTLKKGYKVTHLRGVGVGGNPKRQTTTHTF